MSTSGAAVTVVIPTHDHPTTLPYSIRSVLEQTVTELDVVVIGDGVTDDTRDVMQELTATDARVRFIDRPKSPRHAEPVRHEVLMAATSPRIAYHGDDDLLLPHHLETMTADLEGRDFVHPLPLLFVGPDVDPLCLPMDLANPAWFPALAIGNRISLTGVVHTLSSYRRLPYGWRLTPDDIATDDYMWRQWFAQPWFRGATSRAATTIKLRTRPRTELGVDEQAVDIADWWSRMHSPGFAADWDVIVDRAFRTAALQAALDEQLFRDRETRRMLRQWDVRVGEFRKRVTRWRHQPPGPADN